MPDQPTTKYPRDVPLTGDTFVDHIHADPERKALVMQEIERVQRGEVQMIPLYLDPLCAFFLVCALQLTLTYPSHAMTGKEAMATIAGGLEARIAEQCPELARILADARQEKGL